MRISAPDIPAPPRRLAPFILLALLLHVVLLSAIHPPARNFFIMQHHPLEVYFSVPPVPAQARIPDKAPTGKHSNPADLIPPPMTQATPLAAQPEATAPSGTIPVFDPQLLIESARSIARDEAIKTEQHIAAQEKKKLNTPVASLTQYLQQPHKEIRLANGVLKIITDAGAVCFQPVPYFARDMPGLFGIPMSCP